jgi:hypothetical protein
MKNKSLYILILVACFAFVAWLNYVMPKPINWKQTYSKNDKIPYGSYVLYELLPQLFTKSAIINNNQTLYEWLDADVFEFENYAYLLINKDFSPSKGETVALFDMAARGAVFFIASSDIAGFLGDTLALTMQSNDFALPEILAKNKNEQDSSTLHLSNSKTGATTFTFHSQAITNNAFKSLKINHLSYYIDEQKIKILGTNEAQEPNFICAL